ncbi:uncharacterized protein LOC131483189 [Ochotona princeps]|uniref:uncharacterized protein LOC131483189 n=1 Tax=Ochotona princeps TaxID=9978 RepID=UPI002714B175|nr:uncharacterized protein LOC131483189 [Ochotona princeps]
MLPRRWGTRADEEAKRVATTVGDSGSKEEEAVWIAAIDLPIPELPELPPQPSYTSEDLEWIQRQRLQEIKSDNWYRDSEGRLLLPTELGKFYITNLHETTHLGWRKLLDLFNTASLRFPHQNSEARLIVVWCAGCRAMKPSKRGFPHTGRRNWTMGASLTHPKGRCSAPRAGDQHLVESTVASQQPAKTQASEKLRGKHPVYASLRLIFVVLAALGGETTADNPHQPYNITWKQRRHS